MSMQSLLEAIDVKNGWIAGKSIRSISVHLETGWVARWVSGPFTSTKASVAHWHVTWSIANLRIGNRWWIAILGPSQLAEVGRDLNDCFTECLTSLILKCFGIAYIAYIACLFACWWFFGSTQAQDSCTSTCNAWFDDLGLTLRSCQFDHFHDNQELFKLRSEGLHVELSGLAQPSLPWIGLLAPHDIWNLFHYVSLFHTAISKIIIVWIWRKSCKTCHLSYPSHIHPSSAEPQL